MTIYLPVTTHSAQVGEGKKTREKKTDLVITVSNWHFNRDAQKNPDEIECRPSDCTVGLKFSSTEFALKRTTPVGNPSKVGSEYIFDKCGLSLSYSAFAQLLSDKYFVSTFMTDVRQRYEEKEGSLIGLSDDEDCAETGPTAGTSGFGTKRSAKDGRKKNGGSKRARFIEDEEEPNHSGDEGDPLAPDHLTVSNAELEDVPDSVSEDVGSKTVAGKSARQARRL